MEKNNIICFQTTSEIKNDLNKIAKQKKLSVSELINIIINGHIKDNKELQEFKQNRRRFERKKVHLSAYIGDPRWQRLDFETITIMDISIGGIRFAVPRGSKLEIQGNSNNGKEKFIIIFRLPNYHWPIKVQIDPQQVFESAENIQIRAALVDPDFHAYSALQKFIN